MTQFTVRYSGRGAGVLRTETVAAHDDHSAMALVKRRLGGSRTFKEAHVFQEGECLFNITAGGEGPGCDRRSVGRC